MPCVGYGADVTIINKRKLWQEAATRADLALVEELLTAGCPLPPGGVQQLVSWLPATSSDTAQASPA
jgi:hypothetical protein